MENLNSCLIFLSNIGVVTEGIQSKDINDGNLKAILGLLFNLSRYKQQLKQQSSSASTPSAVSSNGSTQSGNNNVHKPNRASILRTSTTGIPTLSVKPNELQSPKSVTLRKPDGLVVCKKNINNNNNNNNSDTSVGSSVVSSKRNSAIKTKRTDSPSNNSSVSSTYSTSIPLPANISTNNSVKNSPLIGEPSLQNCRSASVSSNSPVLKKSSNPTIDTGNNMFDRFKLFRNSANERINRGSPLHNYSSMSSKDNGSVLISDPITQRSMTPFNPRLMHNFNPNLCPLGTPNKLQQVPYSMFEGQSVQQVQQPNFHNFNSNLQDIKFQPTAPVRTESVRQSASTKDGSVQKNQCEQRKTRNKELEPVRMETVTNEPSLRSSSRHERQKAKDLYTALKQRDRSKFNFSPQIVDNNELNRESMNNKQVRMMSSQEFTQLIQNDPRLRQYVENQSNVKRNMILESNKNAGVVSNDSLKKQTIEIKSGSSQTKSLQESTNLSAEQLKSDAGQLISDKNRRKVTDNKQKPIPPNHPDLSNYTSNVMGKKEPLLWLQHRPSVSGTDSSEYSTNYACMRKYASDFEADLELDSSVEISTQTDKSAKMGYYSDSDSILNPRFGKLDQCPNSDLSALISEKLVGYRRLMNTSGMDPATYLSYQKNLLASKRGTPQSADKDRIYGIVLNSNVARSAAGPAPATFEDLQLQSCFSLPSSQNFLRSNSARYTDTISSDKSFPQNIKLPYATNTNSFISKTDVDSSQNNGSSLSLASNESRRSMSEDKQSQEIRKLRHELEMAQQKVITLSSRLKTNAHMASAFELSLMNVTERLQKLSETSERKDHELLQLRNIIESLRQQGFNSTNNNNNEQGINVNNDNHTTVSLGRSMSATVSPAHFQNSLGRVKGNESNKNVTEYDSINNIGLIGSSESCTSLVSTDIGSSLENDQLKKQAKKGWFRSSLGKAFRKKFKHSDVSMSDIEGDYYAHHSSDNRSRISNDSQNSSKNFMLDASSNTIENLKQQLQERDLKLTDAQLEALSSAHQLEQLKELLNAMRCEMSTLRADNERLQKMVRIESDPNEETNYNTGDEDSSAINDISLTSTTNKVVQSVSESINNPIEMFSHLFKFSSENEISIGAYVYFNDVIVSPSGVQHITNKVLIGSCHISESSTWSQLESHIRCLFKEYLCFNDPFANLGINSESIEHYSLGSVQKRSINDESQNETDSITPYQSINTIDLEAEENQIKIILRSTKLNNPVLDALAFDTLIPKTVLHRYVSLLVEHRLIILCGPSGTGKTYLANKLAKHLITRHGQEVSSTTLAMFTVDHKSNKELRTYLATIAEQSQASFDSNNCRNLVCRSPPVVVILDNLHHVNSLAEIFDSFLISNIQNRPYVIGTMTQASFSNTNLQAHHNFRWVLCANHMEPVKGFLGRYLRRKLIQAEWQEKKHDDSLLTTVEWISKVWQHINKFLESHSSSDVTIGPRLFLSCPMSMEGSQIWFTDLWNYSLVPYLLEAVREGLQTFGRRSNWEDPVDWILQTWPWISSNVKTRNSDPSSLIRLRPEDVGYDSQVPLNLTVASSSSLSNCQSITSSQLIPQSQHSKFLQDSKILSLSNSSSHRHANSNNTFPRTDPLLNMLIKLQEAANYSTSPSSNDSDLPSSKSNSLSRINSSVNSSGQTSQIHKIFKTDIL